MRLARSDNLPEPESPKFNPAPEEEYRRPQRSAPRELPSTKKSQMIPDSYYAKNNTRNDERNDRTYDAPQFGNSRFGGRVNDSIYKKSPSQTTLRRETYDQGPQKPINANDTIHSLAKMLAENKKFRK